jgi:hypothetical protein
MQPASFACPDPRPTDFLHRGEADASAAVFYRDYRQACAAKGRMGGLSPIN